MQAEEGAREAEPCAEREPRGDVPAVAAGHLRGGAAQRGVGHAGRGRRQGGARLPAHQPQR